MTSAGEVMGDEALNADGSWIVRKGGEETPFGRQVWSASSSKFSFSPQSEHFALGRSGSSTVARSIVKDASIDTSPTVADPGDG